MEMENDLKYKIISIVNSHNPPNSFKKLIDQLQNLSGYVIIIDNSNDDIFERSVKNIKVNEKISIFHRRDLGLGEALNFGISKAFSFGEDNYVLVVEDDATFNENINLLKILDDFLNFYSENDVLFLNDHDNMKKKEGKVDSEFNEIKEYLGINMFFSQIKIFKKIKFREEFFMDQNDIDFQYDIRKIGGRIILPAEKIVDRLPVGREIKGKKNLIPLFRIYTITKNTMTLIFEGKVSFISLKYPFYYFFMHIIYKSDLKKVFKALIWGMIDGIFDNNQDNFEEILGKIEYLKS